MTLALVEKNCWSKPLQLIFLWESLFRLEFTKRGTMFSLILIKAFLVAVCSYSQESGFEEAVKKLKDKDPLIRRQAVETIAHSGHPDAIKHLRMALKDENLFVRTAAVDHLGLLRAREAVDDLCKVLLLDKEAQVRHTVAVALGYIYDKSSPVISALMEAVNDKDIGTSLAAVNTLGILKSTESVPLLVKLLKDKDVNKRRTAIYALDKIESIESLGATRDCLNDEDPTVRAQAALICGKFKDFESTATLKDLLKDKDKRVRISSAYALAQMDKKWGASVAKELLNDPDISIRVQAVEILSMVGDRDAIPLIEKLKDDPDPYFKSVVEMSLRRLKLRFPEEKKPVQPIKKR